MFQVIPYAQGTKKGAVLASVAGNVVVTDNSNQPTMIYISWVSFKNRCNSSYSCTSLRSLGDETTDSNVSM